MKTTIKNISEDQNTITHESGFQTVFKRSCYSCSGCIYKPRALCVNIPCREGQRNDDDNGIFIEKNSVD